MPSQRYSLRASSRNKLPYKDVACGKSDFPETPKKKKFLKKCYLPNNEPKDYNPFLESPELTVDEPILTPQQKRNQTHINDMIKCKPTFLQSIQRSYGKMKDTLDGSRDVLSAYGESDATGHTMGSTIDEIA